MSRIGNPQTFADCQSAKQQIDNLRYEKSSRGATLSADTDRLAICATLNRYPCPRGSITSPQYRADKAVRAASDQTGCDHRRQKYFLETNDFQKNSDLVETSIQ